MPEVLERPGRRATVLVARDELVLFEFEMHTPGMRFDEYIRRMDAGGKPDPADYDSVIVDG